MPDLLVMRHGKAAWPDDVPDHERPLADRGRRDAPVVGRWLVEQGLVPQLLVHSDAVRTAQTAGFVLSALPDGVEVEGTPELYEASVARVLEVVARTPDAVGTLLLVGHEPTSSMVVSALTGLRPEMPTAAVAVVRLAGPWAEVAGGSGELVTLRTPKSGETSAG